MEPTIGQIIEALVSKNWVALNEASLGRVYHHWKNGGHKSFAILTTWRPEKSGPDDTEGEVSRDQNVNTFNGMQKKLRTQGYGYNKLVGVGQSDDGTISSKEPSLFVHGITKQHAIEHGKTLTDPSNPNSHQHSIVYSGPETGGRVKLLHLKDDPSWGVKAGDETDLGDFHPKKVGNFYSKLRNKSMRTSKIDKQNAKPGDKDFTFSESDNGPILGWKFESLDLGEAEAMYLEITRRLNESKQ